MKDSSMDFKFKIRQRYEQDTAWKIESYKNYYEYQHEENQIWKLIGNNQRRVLDIGCGYGRFSFPLSQRDGVNVVAIDISRTMLNELCRKSMRLQDSQLQCVIADAEHLPFKPKSFDLIIGAQVITQWLNMEKFFQQIAHLILNEGIIVISVGNSLSLCEMLDRFIWRYKRGIKHISSPNVSLNVRGFWRISYWNLKQLLENSGFEIIGLGGAGLLYHHLIPNSIGRFFEKLSKHFPFYFFSHILIVAAMKRRNS